jgi:UDP-sugar transporter A1/2/3
MIFFMYFQCSVRLSEMFGLDPKMLSLVVLTLQNTTLVLTMRVSRTRENVTMYLSSVAVMTDELMKLVVCIVMLLLAYLKISKASTNNYQPVSVGESSPSSIVPELDHMRSQFSHKGASVKGFLRFFQLEVFRSPFEFFKMAIPALLYAIQKNLLYLAISNLDAAVFQVAYQGKILTTALFSVLVMGKKLGSRQIIALFVLLFGVALVQLSSLDSKDPNAKNANVFVGSMAVTAACFTSGFAAIYFEWVLKKSTPSTTPGSDSYALWVRNFQLATFASISAAGAVWTKDAAAVQAKGLYQGFSPLVWFVVATEAFGGIVVALVIKYADNILKNFATAVSIVTSVIVSALFLGFQVKLIFVLGSVCVMAAVALYTSDPKVPLWGARTHTKEDERSPIELAKIPESPPPQHPSANGVKSRNPSVRISPTEKAEI